MSSELVPDQLNGRVAAGTLALAGATVFQGQAASRAAVDAGSPPVIVALLWVEEKLEPGLLLLMLEQVKSRLVPAGAWPSMVMIESRCARGGHKYYRPLVYQSHRRHN
jgi:hypothetical protein